MRKYATSLLLASTLFVGEIHTFWEGGVVRTQNWIWKIDRPMALQWNIKFVCDQINWLIVSVALLLYVPNRINKTVAASFIVFQIMDIALYFYNYKTYGYGWAYMGLVVFGIIYYNWAFQKRK